MTTALLTRRYLGEYVRRPINLVLLLVVPVVFVALAADALEQFARALGGSANPGTLAAPSAGWAAAFLAGVAGFFHVTGSREADRRMAASGMGVSRVVAARLASGLILATIAAGGALAALAVYTDIADWGLAIGGIAMSALVYLAIGVGIGALVRNEVNGSLAVMFVWMLDAFLGPAMGGGDTLVTRLLPLHFIGLVTMGAESGHAGPVTDLGWALLWTVAAVAGAAAVFALTTRPRGAKTGSVVHDSSWQRLRAGTLYAYREGRRNTAMWAMLGALPVFFITLSRARTPDDPSPVRVTEAGEALTRWLSMADIHEALMLPITVAFLTGLAGLFVVQGSREADRRLVVAGFRATEVLGARLAVVFGAAILTTGVALGVTALDFRAENWVLLAGATLLVAVTFGLIGVVAGSVFGSLGGLYLMFLMPFIDLGIGQNIMFDAVPPSWGSFMPGYGAVRIVVDAAFTSTFDAAYGLLVASVWLVGFGVIAALVFRRLAEPDRA